jgi:hypothetical protein
MQTTKLLKIHQSISSVHHEEMPITSRQVNSFVNIAPLIHSNVHVHNEIPDISSQELSPHASDFLQQNIGGELWEVTHCVMDDVKLNVSAICQCHLLFDNQVLINSKSPIIPGMIIVLMPRLYLSSQSHQSNGIT